MGTSDDYDRYVRNTIGSPEAPINRNELDGLFRDLDNKIDSSEKSGAQRSAAKRNYRTIFENKYGDQLRSADSAFEELQRADSREQVNAVDLPSSVAVGSERRGKLITVKRQRANVERLEDRRSENIAQLRALPIQEVQEKNIGELLAFDLTRSEISQLKDEGILPQP